MTIESLFPTVMFHWDVDSFEENKKEIIKYCYAEKKRDPQGIVKSNSGGWQSDSDHHEGSIIYSFLKKEVSNYLSSRCIFKDEVTIDFDNMWININQKGDYNLIHNHPDCSLSGVLWIKTPENSGKLMLVNPNDFVQSRMINLFQSWVRDDYAIHNAYYMDLVPGRVVLFPSHLLHGVQSNESRQDRISVSFNISLT
tara:strand:+ start:185 stop:775 length:591 start_codon:yes stop_codon:yes gene_type:complete